MSSEDLLKNAGKKGDEENILMLVTLEKTLNRSFFVWLVFLGTRGFLIESHGRQSVLMIPLAQSNHQGKYVCEVNNKAGCKKMKSTYVKVDCK